jgi:3-deoxy-7-phosphoheptulonate synthase
MLRTKNLRIVDTSLLESPESMTAEYPLTPRAAEVVVRGRAEADAAITGQNARPLVIVGPCSIHDPAAALDYAGRLMRLREKVEGALIVVMRVYFEKPRTTIGWKGLINDPHLDGTLDIPAGIRKARALLLEVAELGMPAATELLDPIMPQYIGDLVTWAAIGARTTESQTHREMASGLSMPVGFKNGTDGSLGVAVNAMLAAAQAHSFLGIDALGRVSVVRTAGNPSTHLVLRGGTSGPNYEENAVMQAVQELERAGVNPRVLVDASHGNSQKSHERQVDVLTNVGEQIQIGSPNLLGVMVESNLVGGRQDLKPGVPLTYGQSVTDACLDFSTTERAILELAERAAARSLPVAAAG